ncbi:flagellar assembly protein T N-terminal domain-containing protein [Alteromonas sp. AMM-1]|uniref:flagellar assembly protein T N-terminal domain-containing protein n=1 Tax=Alteromonas sp. AMM-1 TaxID=3394233 RepID=UPI0039A5F9C7
MMHRVCILLLSLFCCYASGQWVEGQASVAVEGAELDEIRVMAIKNAIADAAYKNGSFITAEDIVLDGLLVSSKAQIRTQGRIQRVEIIDETLTDEILTVTVKVDILPLFECASDPYMRSVVVTQFQLLKPAQARQGNIFEFGRQVTSRMAQQLGDHQPAADTLLINQAFMPASAFHNIEHDQIAAKASVMVKEYHRQYVLFGFIRDISLFEQVKEGLLDDDISLRRNFTLEVYLLDALQQDIVMQNSYHGEGDWTFDYNETVDLNNSLFWRSDFGRVVLNTINSAVLDVSNTMTCLPTMLPVVSVSPTQLSVALGTKHGVRQGDLFELYRSALPLMEAQLHYPQWYKQPALILEVEHVSNRSARLRSVDPNAPLLAAPYDLISPAPLL